MKKVRGPILAMIVLFAVLLIAGSFLDLKFSQVIYSKNNLFGLFLAAAGLVPGYGIGAFMCGVLVEHLKNREKRMYKKILLGILAGFLFMVCVYFSSEDIFSINGFYHPELDHYAMLITFPFMYTYAFLGYRMVKGNQNPHLLKYAMTVFAAMIAILLIGTLGIKVLIRRPRYRIVVDNLAPFYPWWKKCANYRDIMETANVLSDEFKSFPSGHTSVAALTMLFPVVLPVFIPKQEENFRKWFFAGAIYTLLIAFSRILVGAHFISDIAMGGLIALIGIYIVNEVYITQKIKDSGGTV